MQSADLNTRSCLSLFEVLILTQSTLSAKCRNVSSIGYLVERQDGVGALAGIVELIMGIGCSGACHWHLSPFPSSQRSPLARPNQMWSCRFALLQFWHLVHVQCSVFCCLLCTFCASTTLTRRTSRPRPRPYWHSNILREFPANKYRRTSTSHSCTHYQHMRG